MARPLRWIVLSAAALLAAAWLWPVNTTPTHSHDPSAHAAGPLERASVAWIGHSLINARAPKIEGARNAIELVGEFARAQGLAYEAFDHTLWGTSLSVLWRGAAHARERSAPEMRAQREALFACSSPPDVLVLTEGVPLAGSLRFEHSAYYLQQFALAALERNPQARIYLYECWANFQALERNNFIGPPSVYDWRAQLASDRRLWDELADTAATVPLPPPGWRWRFERWFGSAAPLRAPSAPIFLVPIGSVFRRLALTPPARRIQFRGRPLELSDLFTNPYLAWPSDWPLAAPLSRAEEDKRLATLPRREAADAPDDIHPSDLGVYIASLTSFATLYRRSPVGLPNHVDGLAEADARALQEFVWELVRSDPRSGVRAD